MLKSRRQNCHRSKLPRAGAIVTVPGLARGWRWNTRGEVRRGGLRRWIVVAFPLCDNTPPYSIGIHTVWIRALDNGELRRVSGFYCREVA